MSAEGPGRRLAPDEEESAAAQFALGASDRQVAAALGVGTGTANRLRHRLTARIRELAALAATASETGETPMSDSTEDDGVRGEVDAVMRGALLGELGGKRDELAGLLGDIEGRAAASRQALATLEAERMQLLADGKDAAPLRQRKADAEADLADSEDRAGIVRQQVAIAEQRIAEVQAEQLLAELREQLVPAAAERDAVIRSTGGRMAAAVLAVKAAAEEFVSALADEKAARERAELLAAQIASLAGSLGEPGPDVPAEPESTILNVRGGDIRGAELELYRAMGAARLGQAELVAKHLAEVFGWLPPTREEQAAEWERWRQVKAERDRQMLAPQPAPEPWTRPDTASFGVDADGREVRYWGQMPPRPPHPMDAWRR